MAKISLSKRIDATKLHPRTLAPLAGPEVNIPFGALVESIGGDHDREKFLFLGEPYSVRREVFLDAIGPDAAAKLRRPPRRQRLQQLWNRNHPPRQALRRPG